MPQLLTTPWTPRDPTWLADIVRSGQNIQLQRQQLAQAQQRIAMEQQAQQARESQFWAEQKRLAEQQAFQDRKFKWDMNQDLLSRQRQETMDRWTMGRQDRLDSATAANQEADNTRMNKALDWNMNPTNPANVENSAQAEAAKAAAEYHRAQAEDLAAPSPYDAPQGLTPENAPAMFMGPPREGETNPYMVPSNPTTGSQAATGLNGELPQGGPGPAVNPLLPDMTGGAARNPYMMPAVTRQLPDGSMAVSLGVPDRRGNTKYFASPVIVNSPKAAGKVADPLQKAIDDEQQRFNSLVSQANIDEIEFRPKPAELHASKKRLEDLIWAQNAKATDVKLNLDEALVSRVGKLDASSLTEYGKPSRAKIEDVRAKLEAAANDKNLPMRSRYIARENMRMLDQALGDAAPGPAQGSSLPGSSFFK